MIYLIGLTRRLNIIVFTNDDIEEYLLKQKYGSSETLSILMLLYPSLDFNNKFHIDHMYPKSCFNKKTLLSKGVNPKDIPEYIDSVNDIGNLQLLPAIPNIQKQNKDFSDWFEEMFPTEVEKHQYQVNHYLPSMDYSYQNFLIFIAKRKALLGYVLKKILL